MERKRSNNRSTYAIIRTHKSHDRSVPRRVTFRWIWRTGKIHLHLTDSDGGINPCRRDLFQAEIQRREEKNRETRKHPKVIPSPYLNFLTHAPTNDQHSRSSYLRVGHCRNHQGSRASARDSALMGASAASIVRSLR